MPKKAQSRVRWNADEKNALLEAARGLLAQDPGMRLLRAIEQAQSELAEARRRTITQISQVPWFAAGLKSIGVESKRGRPAGRTAAAAAPAPAAPAPAAARAHVPVDAIVAGIKEAVADTLAAILARVFERVGPSVQAAGAKRRGRPPGSKSKPVGRKKSAKKRLA